MKPDQHPSRGIEVPSEFYHENGQLQQKGVWNMGEACGEWIVEGDARTYPPCPPDLEDGN
jgi:hypothetical protein